VSSTQCSGCNASVLKDPWHDLSCVHRRKNELNLRHDLVIKCLKYYADITRACCRLRLEPNGLSEDDRERLDLELFLEHIHQLVDLTIVHPTSRSYLNHTQRPLAPAELDASRKLSKYSARQLGYRLKSFHSPSRVLLAFSVSAALCKHVSSFCF